MLEAVVWEAVAMTSGCRGESFANSCKDQLGVLLAMEWNPVEWFGLQPQTVPAEVFLLQKA